MLAANETVAEHLCALHKPAVYRVHEKPAPDKAEGLKTLLAPFGYDVPQADGFTLQKILDDVREKPEAPVVGALILRSMMKARYDVQNLGHFGLAAEYYCHFTSPIRRYPDLMVHRCLTLVIGDGEAGEGHTMPWEKKMAALAARAAEQSSARELAIQAAEREIEKLYMAEYMHGHLGETFPGTVSGVVKQGLFIALPNCGGFAARRRSSLRPLAPRRGAHDPPGGVYRDSVFLRHGAGGALCRRRPGHGGDHLCTAGWGDLRQRSSGPAAARASAGEGAASQKAH